MALNLLKLSILFFLLFVVKSFSFVEPKTLEAFEHPFTKTLQNLEGVHKGQKVKGMSELKSYLQKFGYLENDNSSNDNFDENVESALKDYQAYHHLPVTGQVDVETIERMSLPRCGVPDIVTPHKRNKLMILANFSFFPGLPKWDNSKRALTYTYMSSANVLLSMNVVRQAVENAFQSWSKVSDFTFTESENGDDQVDIVIGFHRGDHGDGYPFDGPGQVLAHAFAPQDGRLHYDAEEQWTTNPTGQNDGLGGIAQNIDINDYWRGRRRAPPSPRRVPIPAPPRRKPKDIDLETVALHEIGHLMGLGHSSVFGSVMFPTYGGLKRDLTQDDMDGIQALYRSSN